MNKAMLLAMAVGLVGIAATAPAKEPKLTPEEQLAKLTRGAPPGKPTSCISQTMALDSQRIDGLGMVYRIGSTYYVNRFDGNCALGNSDILITSTPSGQLCRGDIGRVVDSTTRMPKGACIFADFIPYQKPKQ